MLSIKNISQQIFANRSNNESNQTNPFSRSFKGNILTADIFESSKAPSFSGVEKFVIKAISFGNRLKSGFTDMWDKANSISIEIDYAGAANLLKSKIASLRKTESVEKLAKRPVAELENIMRNEMAV